MQHIREKLQEFSEISEEDFSRFSSKLSKITVPKKSLVLKQGEVEDYLSFLEAGIVRYNIPKPDYDFTFGFAFGRSFFSGYDSFLTRNPSVYNIEAVTEAVIWRISHADLQKIYEITQSGERIGRKIAEHIYLMKMRRERALLQDSAKKRYLDLLSEQPELLQKIPLKYLASYIGVRPQSLSRIRRNIY